MGSPILTQVRVRELITFVAFDSKCKKRQTDCKLYFKSQFMFLDKYKSDMFLKELCKAVFF